MLISLYYPERNMTQEKTEDTRDVSLHESDFLLKETRQTTDIKSYKKNIRFHNIINAKQYPETLLKVLPRYLSLNL